MTDAATVHRWLLGLILALVAVIVAATLVLMIVDRARAILVAVTRSRNAATRIRANVSVIADLAPAAATADRILVGALGIEAKVRLVADALEQPAAAAAGQTGH